MAALILDASVLIGLLDVAASHHDSAVDEVEAADQLSARLLTDDARLSRTAAKLTD